jgi:parallel beta-helix repeat protein
MKSKIVIVIGVLLCLSSIFLVSALPSYFDWKNKDGQNWMTSVKYQGTTCGSCWAFSAIGTVEAQYNIAKNNSNYDLDLSEEYLVSDCFQGVPHSDCRGGWNYQALEYITDNGVSNETCFPYNDYNCGVLQDKVTCSSATCNYYTNNKCSDYTCSDRCGVWQNNLYKIDNYESVSPSENITEIENWLVNHGPISADMKITGGYFNYNATENNTYRCNIDYPVDHAVIITGYNNTGNYWIVKNSYGTDWPIGIGGGYFNVGFGECAIESLTYGVDIASCECSNWTAGSCGSGGCGQFEKPYTRTCNPSGCQAESDCEFSQDCAPPAGEDITVCATGCDYTTIMDAIENSGPNDRIYVTDSRTYDEQVYMDSNETAGWLMCTSGATIDNSDQYGVFIQNVAGPAVIGCNIVGSLYGIWDESSQTLIQDNNITNCDVGIYIWKHLADLKVKENNIINSSTHGIEFYTNSWSDASVNAIIEENIIRDSGSQGVYMRYGLDNIIKNNNLSKSSDAGDYGLHLYSNDKTSFAIINNNFINENYNGLYLDGADYTDINNNTFCSSNTNLDILDESTGPSGDNNRCEKPGAWDDAGTTGCTYYCDNPAISTLLFPPNNYVSETANINLTCEGEDDIQLKNISLYSNISGIWQKNQTINITGISNITTFNFNNLVNGTNFIWNCFAYDNNSRGSFAFANWSLNIIIPPDYPPNTTLVSPLDNSTDNDGSITFNCSATDDNNLVNISLYGNWSGSWIANETKSLTGISNSTEFTKNLPNGFYKWNCLAYDSASQKDWADANWTIKINITTLPNDTYKFYHKNSTGQNVAWLGSQGNIVLKGKCFSGGNCNSPGSNSIIFGNSTDNYVAFINSTGDLCLEKGDCSDESANCNSPSGSSFIVRNSTNNNVIYIDRNGELCLT